MAEHTHYHDNTTTSAADPAAHPTKMGATKDKFMGGIKETLGTVMHAEGLKESGREQKREGDAEALAAGKGKKHYDPALARKGVGIQHKHMGPNPKKLTEGPCAGCKDGTCQIGHDYDAAICHSCTQGHCEAGHVKDAGLGHNSAVTHGDTSAVSVAHRHGHHGHGTEFAHHGDHHERLHGAQNANLHHRMPAGTCSQCNRSTATAVGLGGCGCTGINNAYDAAACPSCNAGNCTNTGHSARDREMMKKMEQKKELKDKELRKKDKAARKKHAAHDHSSSSSHSTSHTTTATHDSHHHTHGHGTKAPSSRHVDSDYKRDLESESRRTDPLVAQLDAEDRKDMAKLAPKLHKCSNEYHAGQHHVCDSCGQRLD